MLRTKFINALAAATFARDTNGVVEPQAPNGHIGHAEYFGADYSEIFGDDDMEGDDDEMAGDAFGADEIFGGRKRRRRSKAQQIAQAREAGGVYVGERNPSSMREQALPFSRSFTSTESATVQIQPQRMFRPERLVFASLTAAFFTISDVSIAQEPQFVAPGTTLAQLFSEVAVGMRLRGKTANLGAIISINAANIDSTTRVMYGAIIGTVVM